MTARIPVPGRGVPIRRFVRVAARPKFLSGRVGGLSPLFISMPGGGNFHGPAKPGGEGVHGVPEARAHAGGIHKK